MDKIYTQTVKDKYLRIKETMKSIDLKKVTILTGSNGSGKSLIRTQLPFLVRDYLNLSNVKETSGYICSTSMDARTRSNPEWGALSSVRHDTSWIATSQNTLSEIKSLFNSVKNGQYKYLVIDEFEIGCGEETVLALSHYINNELSDLLENTQLEGALIITHSRLGVKNIKHDIFLNIDGMTEDEWLNRDVKPIDLEELDANELFFYIRDLNKDK